MPWNLAELNIAKMMYAPDGPEMQDFNDALDSVNALAEGSEGFVWRLVSDPDDAQAEAMVLWWIPEGHVPTVREAQERLLALRADGPSQSAFGFSETWPPPEGEP